MLVTTVQLPPDEVGMRHSSRRRPLSRIHCIPRQCCQTRPFPRGNSRNAPPHTTRCGTSYAPMPSKPASGRKRVCPAGKNIRATPRRSCPNQASARTWRKGVRQPRFRLQAKFVGKATRTAMISRIFTSLRVKIRSPENRI